MDQFPSSGTLTTAPPPPAEVKIRTMKSDIASMAASGGGMPRFENVKVAGLSTPASVAASEEKALPSNVARTESKSNLLLIVVLLVIVAVLGVVGYLVYMKVRG